LAALTFSPLVRIEGITSSSGNDEDQDVIIIHGVLSSPPSTLP